VEVVELRSLTGERALLRRFLRRRAIGKSVVVGSSGRVGGWSMLGFGLASSQAV
jgi:hypothetical protein